MEDGVKQADLFAPDPVHYADKPTPGLPNWKRVALCGVTYAIAGRDPTITAVGSSDLANVTCPRCLEEAKR